MTCPSPEQLLAMVDGCVERVEEDAIQHHLTHCPRCKGTVDDWRSIVGDVSSSSERYRSTERRQALLTALHDEGRLEVGARPPSGASLLPRLGHRLGVWSRVTAAFGIASLLVVTTVVLTEQKTGAIDPGLQSRGSSEASWSGVQIYRVRDKAPERVTDRIRSSDRLLFAYTNLPPSQFAWLSIIARDSEGSLHWLFPPRDHGTGSISIDLDVAGHELPESLTLDVPPGPLRVVSIFSTRALKTDAIEAWLRSAAGPHPEWGVHATTITVEHNHE